MFALFLRSPSIQRPCLIVGVIILCLSMIAASFASKVWHLILTQGVVYGIGSSLVYFPTLAFIQEWFIRRRGLAFGVMWVSESVLLSPRISRARGRTGQYGASVG